MEKISNQNKKSSVYAIMTSTFIAILAGSGCSGGSGVPINNQQNVSTSAYGPSRIYGEAIDPEFIAQVNDNNNISPLSDSDSELVEAELDGATTRHRATDPKMFVTILDTRREWQSKDSSGRTIIFSCASCQNGLGEVAFALAYREPNLPRVTRILRNLNLSRDEFLKYAELADQSTSRSKWTSFRDKLTTSLGNVVISVVDQVGAALGAAVGGAIKEELGPTDPKAPQNTSASSGPATVGIAGNAAKSDPAQVQKAINAIKKVQGVHNQFYLFVKTLTESNKGTSSVLRVLKSLEKRNI